MATDQKIKRALELITETYKTELKPEMIVTWTMALKNLPDSIIVKGVEELVKTWKWEPYKPKMPGPGDLLAVCRNIYKKQKITNQIENQSEEQLRLDHKEAKQLQIDIKATIKKKRESGEIEKEEKKPVCKPLIVYELCDKYGRPKSYLTNGHRNADHFREECNRQYYNSPFTINHIWMSDQKIHEKDDNGHITNTIDSFLPCGQNDSNSVPMTVGKI